MSYDPIALAGCVLLAASAVMAIAVAAVFVIAIFAARP